MYKIKAKVWVWTGKNGVGWHFVTVPPDESQKIAKQFFGLSKGFGTLPVKVYFKSPDKINKKIVLETSIFPSVKNQPQKVYILPLKKSIRLEVGVQAGDDIDFEIEIKNK